MVAGTIQTIIGMTGLIGVLLRFIGPITIVPVLSLIAMAIYKSAVKFVEPHWGISILYVLCSLMHCSITAFVACQRRTILLITLMKGNNLLFSSNCQFHCISISVSDTVVITMIILSSLFGKSVAITTLLVEQYAYLATHWLQGCVWHHLMFALFHVIYQHMIYRSMLNEVLHLFPNENFDCLTVFYEGCTFSRWPPEMSQQLNNSSRVGGDFDNRKVFFC